MSSTSQPPLARTLTPDGIAIYPMKSSSRPDTEEWGPAVNLVDGQVLCGCEWFFFRLNPKGINAGINANIRTPKLWCKHIKKAVLDCVARGEILITNLDENLQ